MNDMVDKNLAWHLGSSMSALPIIAAVRGVWMRAAQPGVERHMILSKGHASMALYTWLAAEGIIKEEELDTYLNLDSRLQAHPESKRIPQAVVSTGSLGQGLSIANGMALAGRMTGRRIEIAVVMGDGEMDEGQVWEAAATSSHFKLDEVTVIIDRNGTQHTGSTESVKSKEPLADKWRSFGWNVIVVEQDLVEISRALLSPRTGPTVIIVDSMKKR